MSRVDDTFTLEELAEAADWKPGSALTYISKQLKGLVESIGNRRYTVRREFRRLSFDDYRRLADQTRRVYQTYNRDEYEAVVTFQFLLPLTREEELRRALDDLFYADTVQRLLLEAGRERFEGLVEPAVGQSEEDYVAFLAQEAGRRFGGYSISHVAGRFRAADGLISRAEAAERFIAEQRYLIDETTAVALFIVPLGKLSSMAEIEQASQLHFFDPGPVRELQMDLEDELSFVRELFFSLFVEALIRNVSGEDQVWLIEDGPEGRHLHIWSPERATI